MSPGEVTSWVPTRWTCVNAWPRRSMPRKVRFANWPAASVSVSPSLPACWPCVAKPTLWPHDRTGVARRPLWTRQDSNACGQLVHDQPDAILDELAGQLGCGRMTVWRRLRRLKLTRKKKVVRADERDRPDVQKKRRQFQRELAGLDPKRLVFVDEMGATTALARLLRPRSPRRARWRGAYRGTGSR